MLLKFCFLIDLFSWLLHLLLKVGCWSNHCVSIFLSFQFCQCLLHVFGNSAIRCIYTYNCSIFLVNWPSYHYIMSFFFSCEIFDLKSILSKCSHLCSFLVTIYMGYLFPSFHFQPMCLLKVTLFRRHVVGFCRCSKSCETETSPLGISTKSQNTVSMIHSSFTPKGEAQTWDFSPNSTVLLGRWGDKAGKIQQIFCQMIKVKQLSNEFDVLYWRERNSWIGGIQCFINSEGLWIWGKSKFYRVLDVAMWKTGHDWLGLHIWPYLERSRNKEVSIEPRVGLVFENWLTRYTSFLVKWNIYRSMKVWFADMTP